MKISIKEATPRILSGEVISVPTDTVYGLVAHHLNKRAVSKIYELKKRSSNNQLILFVSHQSEITPFISEIPPHTNELMNKFWPGGLTIIFPSRAGSLGIRIPKCEITLDLLRKTGPLFSTSANLSGSPAALSAGEVETYFGIDFPVIDGGSSSSSAPSTIIAYKNNCWSILREGVIARSRVPFLDP